MQVSIIGSGRIGLSLGAALAGAGISTIMTDKDPAKKRSVTDGLLPFYEPGLEEAIKNVQSHLSWSGANRDILSADFIFLCLSAPVNKAGEMDLTEVFEWAALLAGHKAINKERLLIVKSTFPTGANKKIQDIVSKAGIAVVTCPEFLRQGQALKDLASPERLVIGARDIPTGEKLEGLYKKFSRPKKVIHTDPETAELAKLACNSFLAVKISFINEFSGLCEPIGGNARHLREILAGDSRIGEKFLSPGLGYGGPCLPKDLQMALQEGKKGKQSLPLLEGAQKTNASLPSLFFKKIWERYKSLKNIPLAFWGLSFKKNTDDLKNSPALDLLEKLLSAGAELHVYDPFFAKRGFSCPINEAQSIRSQDKRSQNFDLEACFKDSVLRKDQMAFLRQKMLSGKMFFYKTAKESLDNRQGLIVGSDDDEFCQISLSVLRKSLAEPFLVDGRSIFSAESLKKEGFSFYQRGRLFIQ